MHHLHINLWHNINHLSPYCNGSRRFHLAQGFAKHWVPQRSTIMGPKAKKRPAAASRAQHTPPASLHEVLATAKVPRRLMLHIFKAMAEHPSITMEMVADWWPEMSTALLQHANGGLAEEDPISEDDWPAAQGVVVSPTQPYPGEQHAAPAVGEGTPAKRTCSAVASGKHWTPTTLYEYFSPEAVARRASLQMEDGTTRTSGARSSADCMVPLINVDDNE